MAVTASKRPEATVYTAIVGPRDGDWFLIEIPEVPGVFSQAREAAEVEEMARDAIALALDVPLGEIAVSAEWREPFFNRTSKSIRIEEGETRLAGLESIHPGEILAEEFLEPLGVSQYRLAMAIGVPPRRINEIVHGKRRISADTALRLARYFGTSDRFWMNLQNRYDLEIERDRLGSDLRRIKPFAAA